MNYHVIENILLLIFGFMYVTESTCLVNMYLAKKETKKTELPY